MSLDENEAMISTNNTNEGPDSAPVLDCEESSLHGAATTTGPTALDPNDTNDNDLNLRRGTIPSARFNILSTMVGGGCLSLPLAFQKSGNGLLGPLILLVVAVITDFCFRLLVDTANIISGTPDLYRPGKDSFESITSVAFGAKAYVFSMALVTAMCFFGAVGYTVLLRDMLEPINDMIQGSGGGDHDDDISSWWHKNLSMFVVVFLVTPACTLSSFTALKNCGAASMCSILILGSCIVYRSIQCNIHAEHAWYTYVTFLPESPKDILDAAPLFISCFVCHYNILPVHNELQQPTPQRVSWWLRSTTWFAAILYMIMAFAGSALYRHGTSAGQCLVGF
jgi:amino acid permease